MVGASLGPYKIVEQLGAGGMGEVYLAEDTRLGRRVAVKVLPAEFASDPERLARFEQEARAAAALNHPHIAVVHDIGYEDETHYIVQEHLEGESLADVVARGAMPAKRALALGEQIARALAAAHAAGIVHRDLKPANVFVTPEAGAKVLDFGLAKLTEAASAGAAGDLSLSPTVIGTMAGTVMGTAGYMAPEQINGEQVDRRADLFAFGCVLYEMVTGRRAFAGQSIPDTLAKVLHSEPELIDAPATVAPAELDRILRKCLMKERAARYQHADDLAVDLGALRGAVEAGTAGDAGGALGSMDPITTGAVAGTVSRAKAIGLAAAVGITAIALTAAGMWWARTETPAPPLRTFTIPYPQDAPMAVYCCATSLAIAPDDSYLLFGAISGRSLSVGALRFYIHRFDTGETRSVDWATRGYMPTISPDSREFAYVELPAPDAETRVAADFRLVRIALAGGAPFDLGISSPAPPSWGKDNNIYLGSRSADQSVITRLPGVGGEPETLVPTDLGDGVTIGRVAPFPERGFVLFERHHDAAVGIGVLDLDTMRARELVPEGRDPRLTSTGHLLWHRDGVVYAAPLSDDGGSLAGSPVPVLQGILLGVQQSAQFAVSEAGTLARVYGERSRDRTYSLLSIDASGNTQVESSIVSQFADVRLSPDGGRIAFTRGTIGADSRGDIWVHDLARDATAPLTTDGASFGHVWSHDGEWIYYQRRSDADPGDVWRLRADGGGEAEPVLELPGAQRPVSMSQDGRTLLYGNNVSALLYGTLGLLSLDDREATELSGIADVQNPRLSPDGRLVAYQSRESGIDQVYVVDLAAGGARHPISSGRGAATRPVWAPDGSALLFFTETGPRTLYRVSFSRTDGGALQISAPERELTGEDTWQLQDIFPDGRILVSDPQLPGDGTVQRDEIRVTLNWFQELERLSPRDGAR